MTISEYRRITDPLVEPRNFKSNRYVLAHVAVHLLIVTGGAVAVARWGIPQAWPLWAVALLAIFCGHSIACLGLAAHEIGHGICAKTRLGTYLWETAAWTYSGLITTTVHRKAHNAWHHDYTNGPLDPNRRQTSEEIAQNPLDGKIAEWIFPNSKHPVTSAFVGLWLVNLVYQLKLLVHSVLATGDPRWDMRLSVRKRRIAVAEQAWYWGVYLGFWAMSGFRWEMALFLFLANYVGTTIGLWYICTNHLVNPMSGDGAIDPLVTATSIKLPGWVDYLHSYFSHHPEHHLYPAAGPANYPKIRKVLMETFPDRFNMLTAGEVMRELLASPIAYKDPNTLVSADGTGERPVTFPEPAAVR